MAPNKSEKIDVENVDLKGRLKRVDADLYKAMKRAFLKIFPNTSPA